MTKRKRSLIILLLVLAIGLIGYFTWYNQPIEGNNIIPKGLVFAKYRSLKPAEGKEVNISPEDANKISTYLRNATYKRRNRSGFYDYKRLYRLTAINLSSDVFITIDNNCYFEILKTFEDSKEYKISKMEANKIFEILDKY